MKKKNGFTLIELLAVIVILAVIALIAVPQVLKILKQSRLSAAEDSVYGVVKATETYYANYLLKNTGSAPAGNLTFECKDNKCKTNGGDVLDFKGNVPKGGTVTISRDGSTITAEGLVINGFICKYDGEKASCDDNGSTPSTSKKVWAAVTGDGTNVGDIIKINGTEEQFYVIKNDGTTLNALAEYNLNAGNMCTIASSCTPIENPTYKQDEAMTGHKNSSYGNGSVAFSDNNGWPFTNNDDIDIQNYDGPVKTAINEYKEKLPQGVDVRLITKIELEELGCLSNSYCSSAPSWVYSTTYWTGSAVFSGDLGVWNVSSGGYLGSNYFGLNSSCGVRPVITVEA